MNRIKLFIINYRNRNTLPPGTKVIIKKCDKFPEGALGKVISKNTFECEYQITTVLESKPSHSNPYILEHEDGLKVTQEEFDTAEYVPFELVEKPNYVKKNPVMAGLTALFIVSIVNILLALVIERLL